MIKLKITLFGCDDITEVILECSEEKKRFLDFVASNLRLKAERQCQPLMIIRRIEETTEKIAGYDL